MARSSYEKGFRDGTTAAAKVALSTKYFSYFTYAGQAEQGLAAVARDIEKLSPPEVKRKKRDRTT